MKNKEASRFGKMRVFIVESVSPLDLLESRHETASLVEVCKIIGHDVVPFRVNSREELESVCKYISTIDAYKDDSNMTTLCLHLSAHGNDYGLTFGCDDIGWDKLFKCVRPVFQNSYPGSKVLTLSCCNANKQLLTKDFKKSVEQDQLIIPPKYIFTTRDDAVYWSDAIVGWTILYHQLPSINFEDKDKVVQLLKNIKALGVANFAYYRWNEDKNSYRSFVIDRSKDHS